MSAAHRVHLADEVGTWNPNCSDCREAVVQSFREQWKNTPKPGYSSPQDLMHKISGWEWANTFVQTPEGEGRSFTDMIGWFANALEAGRAAGYRQAQDQMRNRLGL